MSEVDWESENFEPNVGKPVSVPKVTDKWDGEDDDDGNIRDNWDDEEQEKEDKGDGSAATSVQVPKKKRPLKERLAEKEEKQRKELEEKRKKDEEAKEAKKMMTPKELHEENKRRQKIQEENDLALAIDAFGLSKSDRAAGGVIDSFEPSSKEEFEKFSELLSTKICKYEKSPHYETFLESLYQKLALSLEAESIKKLSSTLTVLSNEKVKQTKGLKGKKKNQKASLVVGKDTEALKDDDAIYDEFDDYL